MRVLLSLGVVTLLAVANLGGHATSVDAALGTWSGRASCVHGDGETFTMVISRDTHGALTATMDWALSRSDGARGPGMPVTAVKVDGERVTASLTRGERTIRLDATVRNGVMTGKWATDGDTDVWTFTGKRQPTPAPR
jgi:hypothetical protein